ncbi:hypothetical protein KAI56_03090 [Candidatus Parcubacteria bacterium]|nr:hypothetical protein [Candidatus Parcubacteria bacterium]
MRITKYEIVERSKTFSKSIQIVRRPFCFLYTITLLGLGICISGVYLYGIIRGPALILVIAGLTVLISAICLIVVEKMKPQIYEY